MEGQTSRHLKKKARSKPQEQKSKWSQYDVAQVPISARKPTISDGKGSLVPSAGWPQVSRTDDFRQDQENPSECLGGWQARFSQLSKTKNCKMPFTQIV